MRSAQPVRHVKEVFLAVSRKACGSCWDSREQVTEMNSSSDIQRSVCQSFGASFLQCDEFLKIGISKDFDPQRFPINGLRHPPSGDTAGWYIWSGEYSHEPDFFFPLHTKH